MQHQETQKAINSKNHSLVSTRYNSSLKDILNKNYPNLLRNFPNLLNNYIFNFQVPPRTFPEMFRLDSHFLNFNGYNFTETKKNWFIKPFLCSLYIYPRESNNMGIESSLCRRCCVSLLTVLSEAWLLNVSC